MRKSTQQMFLYVLSNTIFMTYPESFVEYLFAFLDSSHVLLVIVLSSLYISHPIAFRWVRSIDSKYPTTFWSTYLKYIKKIPENHRLLLSLALPNGFVCGFFTLIQYHVEVCAFNCFIVCCSV